MLRTISLVALLAGCGGLDLPLPETAPYIYNVDGLEIRSAVEIDPVRVESSVRKAAALLLGATQDTDSFAAVKQRLVYVHGTLTFADGGEPRLGMTTTGNVNVIVLGSDGRSLLHEFFHAWQVKRGVPASDTLQHLDWDGLGYKPTADSFRDDIGAHWL